MNRSTCLIKTLITYKGTSYHNETFIIFGFDYFIYTTKHEQVDHT